MFVTKIIMQKNCFYIFVKKFVCCIILLYFYKKRVRTPKILYYRIVIEISYYEILFSYIVLHRFIGRLRIEIKTF